MTLPRKALVSLDATPYYHCVSRCVRRAFLCGHDTVSGQSYEHRRKWIEDRILNLSHIFALDVCAYAVMSNHYHVVLHVNSEAALRWSEREVVERWHSLFKGTPLTQRFLKGEPLCAAEFTAVQEMVAHWRARLTDISWFMRLVNEGIARASNREDRCSGRFWEGRFKSQALLDEQALAACMAYVDLNPIRANMANSPEDSAHTSVKRRITAAESAQDQRHTSLFPFVGNPRQPMPQGLPFHLKDYLALVDWTGRIIREDKRGAIPHTLPPILDRLAIEPKHWLFLATQFESRFKSWVGTAYSLKQACAQLGRTPRALAPILQG